MAEDTWILISASACNLLQFVVIVEICEENSASYQYVVGKGLALLVSCGYSSLIQQVVVSYRLVAKWNQKPHQ